MIYEHTNYRSYLRSVLVEKASKNPAFSLRAMAKHLEMPPSQFSQALNGKANLSVKTGRRIAHKLSLGAREEDYLCLLIQLEAEKDEQIRSRIVERIRELHSSGRELHDPGMDTFRHIADWHHSAILELLNLKNFAFTPERVARKLKIPVMHAREAIERLERLGLIMLDAQGKWRRTNNDLCFVSPTRSQAMVSFHRQILEKLSKAFDTQAPFKERLSAYQNIPFAPEALPEIERAMDRFLEDAVRIARRHADKTEVYHLGVHFFNLTEGSRA